MLQDLRFLGGLHFLGLRFLGGLRFWVLGLRSLFSRHPDKTSKGKTGLVSFFLPHSSLKQLFTS